MRTGIGKGLFPLWPEKLTVIPRARKRQRNLKEFCILKDISSLILLGITISVGISTGFNPQKMAIKMRQMAIEAIHDARTTRLPTLKGMPSPNPFGCGTYECHKEGKIEVFQKFALTVRCSK